MLNNIYSQQSKPQKARRKPVKTTPVIEVIKSTTFKWMWGETCVAGKCLPKSSMRDFIGRYNSRRRSTLKNCHYQDHFVGRKTYFYWSCPNQSSKYALLKIDVDCKNEHERQEGLRFLVYLKVLYPDLTWEPSTGGMGWHAYILVEKHGRSPKLVKHAFNHFQTYLRGIAQEYDFYQVEVKGHPPLIEYGRHGQIVSMNYGIFAKLPRTVEVFHTLSLPEILDLQPRKIERKKAVAQSSVPLVRVAEPEIPLDEFLAAIDAIGTEDTDPVNPNFIDFRAKEAVCETTEPVTIKIPAPVQEVMDNEALVTNQGVTANEEVTKKTTKEIKLGSSTGLPATEEQLAQIPELVRLYRPLAYRLMNHVRNARELKGKKIVFTDFIQALIVLSICGINPNEDGQLPKALCMAVWTKLYQAGLFSRGWDNSRWARITQTLGNCGLLVTEDMTYWFNPKKKKGEKYQGRHEGKAMIWSLRPEYQAWSEEFTLGESSDQGVGGAYMGEALSTWNSAIWTPTVIYRLFDYHQHPTESESVPWELQAA